MADMGDLFGSDESDKEAAKRSDHSASESEENDGNESDSPNRSHHSPNAERSGSDVQSERSGEHSDALSEDGNRSKSESDGPGSAHVSEAENQEDSDGNESQSGDDQASKNGGNSESDEPDEQNRASDQEKSGSDDEGVPQRTRKSSGSSRSSSSSSSERDERPEPQHSGSENEEDLVESPRKKQRLITSEDEEGSPQPNATAQDIFGDDVGDISSADEGSDLKRKTPDEENFDGNNENVENGIERTLENGDMEQEEPVPETRIEVEIPRISTNLGKEVHFVKLPNFLSVETRPYDPQWYEDEIDEDEVLDEEGRARLKLKVENTVRWRYAFDDDGNAVKESNAKIVRWSDGSLSLHLGSEIFDIHKQSLMQGDHNHLFIRQGTGLQGQAVFRTKLSFRPHSTDSFTHHKMTLSLANRSLKTQKIRVLPNVGKDPEAHRSEMIKKEEDKLKASIRRDNKKRRMREKSHGRGLNASYLEDDDDEEGISLSAIKKSYKKGGAGLKERPPIYSSDEESVEEQRERRLEQAKNMDMDDDSDLDYFDKKSSEGKKKATKIEDSSENSSSENGETGGGGDAVEEEED